MVSQEIFRAYDIRGIVDDTLTEESVLLIGKAIGSRVIQSGFDKVIVGRDGRLSGLRLQQSLVSGITSTGCNVIIIGEVATPLLYFAQHHLKSSAAVMITGSHNPKNYNGLKIIINHQALFLEQIQELYHLINNRQCIEANVAGSVEFYQQIIDDYIDSIADKLTIKRNYKIAIDCGNGVAGAIAPQLFAKLNCQISAMYCDVDGNFPNHHPDPGNPKNLVELQQKVVDENLDLGIAFDGDGDRLGIVDNQGKVIWPDRALMLLCEDILARNANATIIYDVKCSQDVGPWITSLGGQPCMWKTGHSLIKDKMKQTGAILAAEMSGHFFIKDNWFGFDDGLYSAARLIDILAKHHLTSSSEVFKQYPENISTPEIAIAVNEQEKFKIVAALKQQAKFADALSVNEIDGLRADFTDGWGLIRASNTTPNLIARFEGKNESAMLRIKQQFLSLLKQVYPQLDLNFNSIN